MQLVEKHAVHMSCFYEKKPSVSYLKVWECLAYVKLPDRQLTALGQRSVSGMFVVYEIGSKAYRIFW